MLSGNCQEVPGGPFSNKIICEEECEASAPDSTFDEGSYKCLGGNCVWVSSPGFHPTLSVCEQQCFIDGNGVDLESSIGCTNPTALNYDALAIDDDGSCE